MNMAFRILLFLFYIPVSLNAQSAATECASAKTAAWTGREKRMITAQQENDYDVHYLFFDLAMTNQSTALSGHVTTHATVVASGMPEYVFELSEQLTIDSVKFNSMQLPVQSTGSTRTVVLPVPAPFGSVFSAQVFYHGMPQGGYGPIGYGISQVIDERWNIPVTYTLSEPYFAKDWWPSKQSLEDKIDSTDIWITVPPGHKAGSNGLLRNVSTLNNGDLRYEWKSHYPISYYLISATVAPYQEYARYMHFEGSTDSMLLQDYIYDHPDVLPLFKNAMDSVEQMIHHLSGLFGRYPFYQEKYGHCLSPQWGGMEHQTMTTLRHFGFNLVVHELAHQWFGDYVTCASWTDIWLNEGFASYCEYLATQYFKGGEAAADYIQNLHGRIVNDENPYGSVYVYDTSDIYRVFDGRLTYDKAGAVLHTLRFIVNDDSLFFRSLRNYLDTYAFGTAKTENLQQALEQTTGRNLDTFFQQWIYKEGFPLIELKWNQQNSTVIIQINQKGAAPESVPFFSIPLELQFSAPDRDTLIKIYLDKPQTNYSFTWAHPIQNIKIDPNNWLINTELVHKDISLIAFNEIPGTRPLIYPNPATDSWHIALIPEGSDIRLLDMSGHLILHKRVVGNNSELSARYLASGIYLLELRFPDGTKQFRKLWRG